MVTTTPRPAELDVEVRWRRWLAERNRRGLRLGLIIMIQMYPAFGLLDWLRAPREAVPWLWATRGLVVAVTLALFFFLRSPAFERWGEHVSAAHTWLGGTGIAIMTPYMGGLSSPYYAGISLMLLSAALLMLWRLPIVIATHGSVIATFVIVNAIAGTIGPLSQAISNLAFLSSTALVAGIGQVLTLRTLRDQHAQRIRLEQATAKLERAHTELQQLDQFKSRFFANMTHELRTPLAMILAPLELILQGEMGRLGEAQRGAFTSMFRSALKLLKLINDLLDLSRLEESRLRLDVAEHDLVPYLRELTQQTQVLAARRNITLSFSSSVGEAKLFCDLERVERVLVNLLSNAIKFAPPGSQVEVALSATEETVEIVVQDDGPGFPPEQAERIFERFFQVDMEGTRRHGGAGIGLALARELVILHGGTISATSDGVRGARFTVSLPTRHRFRGEEVIAPYEPPSSEHTDWTVQLERRGEFRLLDIDEATERRFVERDLDDENRRYTAVVVEDDPRVLQVVHMALRREFRVLAAPDGLKGLELAARERPSLVVTDLMMPGIDGFELTRRLRDDPRTGHVPILMLSARGEVDSRVKGLETGVSAYLGKPFSPRELLTTARRLVRAEEETADLVLSRRMESIEIVAAGLAHEINNPLNYVKNALARVGLDAEKALALAGVAKDRPLDAAEQGEIERAAARVKDMLGVAESGLRRIAGTVELMSRYGRAGFRRETSVLDVWEAVRTVASVVLPATGRKVSLDLDLRGDGTLECVPEEFQQVLTNLVQNAIEAAPEGEGRVRVTGTALEDALVLTVKDNGPGMSAETQARLFTPFFTTKGPGRGMGLGLTIVHRVVESLGGTLQVVSAPGAGAEFVVRVPRQRRKEANAASAEARA